MESKDVSVSSTAQFRQIMGKTLHGINEEEKSSED